MDFVSATHYPIISIPPIALCDLRIFKVLVTISLIASHLSYHLLHYVTFESQKFQSLFPHLTLFFSTIINHDLCIPYFTCLIDASKFLCGLLISNVKLHIFISYYHLSMIFLITSSSHLLHFIIFLFLYSKSFAFHIHFISFYTISHSFH